MAMKNFLVLAMAMVFVLLSASAVESQTSNSSAAYIEVTKYEIYNCGYSVTGYDNYTIGECLSRGSQTDQNIAIWLFHHYNLTTNAWIGSDVIRAVYTGPCIYHGLPWSLNNTQDVSFMVSIGYITPNHTTLACQTDEHLGLQDDRFTIVNPLAAPVAPFSTWPPVGWRYTSYVVDSNGHYVSDCHLGNDTHEINGIWEPDDPSHFQCLHWISDSGSYSQHYCNHDFSYFAVYPDSGCASTLPLTTRMSLPSPNPRCDTYGTLTLTYCVPPPTDFIRTLVSQDNMVIERSFNQDLQCQSSSSTDTYLAPPNADVIYSQASVCFAAIDDQLWTQYECHNNTMTGELTITETKYSSSSCTSDKIKSQHTIQVNACGGAYSPYPYRTFVCTSYQPYVPPSSSTGGDGSTSHATNSYESTPLYLALSFLTLMTVTQTKFWY